MPYAIAGSSFAAIVSPMLTGTLADRHFPAERILRWLALGVVVFLALNFLAIEFAWGAGWVLAFLQLQQLCSVPTWGLASVIVLARLPEPEREFGPVRVWATFGWLIAGLLVSFVWRADGSTLTGFLSVGAWLGVAIFTRWLPPVPPRESGGHRRWRDLLGLEALTLLRDPNHRAVFVTAALFSVPLAAFYPFAALHLRELGETHVAAAMSLGQVSEVIAMYALAPLLARMRLKTVFLLGFVFAVLRYVLFAHSTRGWVLAGIALHGFCFTPFFIPAQIYLEKRIEPRFRSRAQALLTLMMSGIGNLLGAGLAGALLHWCAGPGGVRWDWFWGALAAVTLAVMAFFTLAYRDRRRIHALPDEPGILPATPTPFITSAPD